MTTLTLANSVFLMSVAKPILFTLVLGGWAWVVAFLDKDAGFYYLKRELFNLLHVLAGVLGFGLMLLVPVFWVGLPMGILLLAGSVAGYVVYRNGQVPEAEVERFVGELPTETRAEAGRCAAGQGDFDRDRPWRRGQRDPAAR